ncbi:MAG: peptidase prolyl oligopeptidase active site domain protein [Verrucomicrobia bacterium]|nr:peptidase prolyl oligopeptidase active site domain protein [Verrucomicrobiota bacterium]
MGFSLPKMLTRLGLVFCVVSQFVAAAAAPVPVAGPPPAESFARLPAIRHVTISRDGKTIAYSVFDDLQVAFAFKDLKTGKVTGVESALGVAAYAPRWVAADRVVYGGMSGIDRDGKGYTGLLGWARQNDLRDQNHLYAGNVFFSRFTGDDSGNVLMYEFDHPTSYGRHNLVYLTFPNVIEMNTRTGKYFRVLDNPGNVVGWTADGKGVIRVGVEWDHGKVRLIYRENEKAPWHRLPGLEGEERTINPLAVSADASTLFLSRVGPNGKWSVYKYDLVKGQLGELLLGHQNYDILPLESSASKDGFSLEQIVVAADTREVLGIQYVTDVPKVVWFDEQMAAIQAALDQGLPDRANTIVDMSDDRKKLVVLSWSGRDPGTYYLFDFDKKGLEPLFPVMPWIKPAKMAEVFPITYKSRDGLLIHGYLTVPAGREPKNLPLVVYPHGGPFARDMWGFSADPQFLASRGYAVLQMNYRGSPGFGQQFFEKGFRQMGTGMQDDITDGTRWAIAQGFADPKRVAIMGWSFGGYSALMGMMREPDLYRCGINLAGVTSWREILSYDLEVNKLWKENISSYLGDPGKDAASLDDQSPVTHVDKLRAPLLFAYSKDDTTVPYEQALLLKDALDKAGKRYEFMSKFNEGHGFYTYKRRLELYQRIEKFLAENMGP